MHINEKEKRNYKISSQLDFISAMSQLTQLYDYLFSFLSIIISDNFTFLQVLDLGGNNLQILPREVFSRHGLLNLQKLKLSNCKIGQIDPTAFRGRLLFRMSFIFEMIKCLICSGLTNLVELDLSSNKLASVPTPTFSGKIQ